MEYSLDPPHLPAVPAIDFRAQLNDEQFQRRHRPARAAPRAGGAGSGKTRTLTYRSPTCSPRA